MSIAHYKILNKSESHHSEMWKKKYANHGKQYVISTHSDTFYYYTPQ